MDGLSLYASCLELREKLVEGRIDKIQQTEKDEVIFGIRSRKGNFRLLINVSASDNRIHLTEVKKQGPAQAPIFCMLLRKRIMGAKILNISQPMTDRILSIDMETYNELGDLATFSLKCELMGKHSNLILVNDNGVVVDAIKHIGIGMSSVRPVMPGMVYSQPPAQEKSDPVAASEDDFKEAVEFAVEPGKALSQRFFGIAPQIGKLLIEKCGTTGIKTFFNSFSEKAEPCVVLDEKGLPMGVLPFMAVSMDCRQADSMGAAYDELYTQREHTEWVKRHGASIKKILSNNIERCEKKLELYADILNSSATMEANRLMGELITANLHSMKSGETSVWLDNYYTDPVEKIEIELDPALTPGENAQRYYKKYQKQKAARDMAAVQRKQTLEELEYLEGQMDNLSKCSAQNELEELVEELRAEGYVKREKNQGKKQKLPASKPLRFVSTDGIEIFAGKNNLQNDRLTLKVAAPNDIWMHTKNIPGSHVIVRSDCAVPERTLYEAAVIAAFYSKARGGENVPVDYTQRKNVKKPSGSKPGMVIYTTNRTAYVTPDEALVRRLES